MFDIGWSELVVIAVVALIAIGPKELPGVLRSVGHWMGKIRQMANEFQGQFQEAMRDAEMADLKKHADDLNNTAKHLTSGLTSTLDPYDTFKESQAASSPPPTPATETAATDTPAHSDTAAAAVGEGTVPPPDHEQVAAPVAERVAAMPDLPRPPEPPTLAPEATPKRHDA